MLNLFIQYDHLTSPRGEGFQGFWVKDRATWQPIHERPFADQPAAYEALRAMAGPETAEEFACQLFDAAWQGIAGDVFQGERYMNGAKARRSFRRSEVFDMCFDHLDISCQTCGHRVTPGQVRAIQDYFLGLPKAKQTRFIRTVLPYKLYGD